LRQGTQALRFQNAAPSSIGGGGAKKSSSRTEVGGQPEVYAYFPRLKLRRTSAGAAYTSGREQQMCASAAR